MLWYTTGMEDYVYNHSEDSQILLEYALAELNSRSGVDCIEVGFGNGKILLEIAKSKSTKFVAGSDINKNAVLLLNEKINSLDMLIKNKITISEQPFFDGFKDNLFDIILFNPPYLPSDSSDKYLSSNEKNSLIGGKKGVETSISFLKKTRNHIRPTSIILLIASNNSNLSFLNDNIMKLGFDFSIIGRKSFDFEEIYCYRIFPKEALKYALLNDTSIKYLSKGSRSFVFTIESNKRIVLKQGIIDMSSNFRKEFEILKLLQGILKVPKPFNLLNNMIIMERIVGIRADKHHERLDIAVFLLDCALVLDALMIFKKEFSRPFTNIIVEENNNISIIDFERAIIGKRGNMNQLCEFLKRESLLNEENAGIVRNINDEFSQKFIEETKKSGINNDSLNERIDFFKKKYSDKRRTYLKKLVDFLIIRGD